MFRDRIILDSSLFPVIRNFRIQVTVALGM